MLNFLTMVALCLSAPSLREHWRYSCLSRSFSNDVRPDYYTIGLIYYLYNKEPAFDPGFIPVIIDTKYSPTDNLTSYRFYFQGKSNQQLYYIFDDKRNVTDKFLNTPSTFCLDS
jgi:hypothetical protein